MKRWVSLAGAALAMLVPFAPAGASGDYGCDPRWKLASDGYSTCGGRAMLAPGNDSRVNLFFLLRDQQRASSAGLSYPGGEWEDLGLGHSFFSWSLLRKAHYPAESAGEDREHYGSRCISLASGGQAFAEAMRASRGLPAAERDRLVQARALLVRRCAAAAESGADASWPQDIRSVPGREFLAYLRSADAFYAENWTGARGAFTALARAGDPWVAETAAYMLGRVELNAAQAASFDEYGWFAGPSKVDQPALTKAREAFDGYLSRYGNGRYAASAQGLTRRTLWLSGDTAGLAREYERLLSTVLAGQAVAADLVQEVDNKLLVPGTGREAVDGPLLLATIDLMRMRAAEGTGTPVISAAELAAQEPRFAGRADLYGFVRASHAFYVAKDMRRVLQLIPDDARQAGYTPLAFSRQMLRGMALAAVKDRNEAGFWRELLGGANGLYQRPLVELGLALNYERSGRLADVFVPASPIGESAIREILLQYIAGPELLRAQVRNSARPRHERDVALFTLLYKQLTRGNYAAFLSDSALIRPDATSEGYLWDLQQQEQVPIGLFRKATWSDGYPCPALAQTAGTLARRPADVKARLCLGDYYRLNGFDGFDEYEVPPAADELGGTAGLFPGKPMPRSRIYADVIADPRAGSEDRAYALYRAVTCYAPSGNNACGGADAEKSQRQAWFQKLKREHAGSPWAQKLRYYW